jgi:hypothetical protein
MGKLKIAAALVGAFAAGAVVSVGPANAAYGFCSQPHAPSAFFSKPSKPYCYTSRNCSEWQIKSYNNDVDRYYRDLRQYAGQVDDYYNSATKYVECMSYLD